MKYALKDILDAATTGDEAVDSKLREELDSLDEQTAEHINRIMRELQEVLNESAVDNDQPLDQQVKAARKRNTRLKAVRLSESSTPKPKPEPEPKPEPKPKPKPEPAPAPAAPSGGWGRRAMDFVAGKPSPSPSHK